MKIQYILHADFETPGAIRQWAFRNQHVEKFCRPFTGEFLPDPTAFDLLVLMGGPQSPLAIEEAPYLSDEIQLIQKSFALGIPILGFCLGAQLIGEAFGAKTERSPHKEVGVFPIQLTEEARFDPLLKSLPSSFQVVHWHNDMPGLTKDAKILAFSQGCPRQIVRYKTNVYGFQCHPEPTKHDIETMMKSCPNDLIPSGKFVQTKLQFLANDFSSINNTIIRILDNLLEVFHDSRTFQNR